MKNLIVFLLIFCLSHSYLSYADDMSDDPTQPCCNGYITTDPSLDENGNPFANNPAKPGATNHFNWMEDVFNVYHHLDGTFTYKNGTNAPKDISNPFYLNHDYLRHINYKRFNPAQESPEKLNFWPEDGWELLHKNNGYLNDESTLINNPLLELHGPHFILYNKYTGKLRVLAARSTVTTEGADYVVTRIGFYIPDHNPDSYKYSAIFSDQNNISQPLDEYTKVTQIIASGDAPSSGLFWAGDFYMAYDPCNCHKRSMLEIQFATIDSAKIDLSGRFIGTSVPLDDDGNSPLLNDERDFLTSVYIEGFDAKAGALTYDNIDALIDKYDQPDFTFLEESGMEILKTVIKGAAKGADTWLNSQIGLAYINIYNNLGLLKTSDKNKMKALGLGVFSSWSDKLYAEIDPRQTIPDIHFIEGEMALTGHYYDYDPMNGYDLEIAVPGSKDSENETYTPLENYPIYNEALGVFALLETPVILFNNNDEFQNIVKVKDTQNNK